ncbi:MAG: hypothetical protein GXO83_03575 [Chlorobi bacterium]|nr:hypothetical protein [Chlorobiota bacterium]
MTFQSFFGTFKEALTITSFVLIILLVVEYIHVQTTGRWTNALKKKGWIQILISALLGATPGCIGAFTVVSFYTHGIVSFSSLVTVMIATAGDEAFVMLAMIPKTGLIIIGITFLIGIAVGFLLLAYEKKRPARFPVRGQLELHKGFEGCTCLNLKTLKQQLHNITTERVLMLLGFLIYLIFLIAGEIGPGKWNWVKVTFVILLSVTIFIIATVPDHFLSKHLWDHVVRKHLLRIFLWTWGTFIFLLLAGQFIDINHWIRANPAYMIVLAILIGIIPESGPHLIFVTLFAQGAIPFSVLLTSSVVQDGHGTLPLLAESRLQFVYVKLINMTVGAVFGFLALAVRL